MGRSTHGHDGDGDIGAGALRQREFEVVRAPVLLGFGLRNLHGNAADEHGQGRVQEGA